MSNNTSPSLNDVALEFVKTGVIPQQADRLSRRKRHVLLDGDIHGDHAYVWFVRRGHSGEPNDETLHFERTDGTWRSTGGGGGCPGADLASRPTMADIAEWNNLFRPPRRTLAGLSSVCDFARVNGGSMGKKSAAVQMQMASGVAEIRITDRPARPVASHGFVTVSYDPRKPPTVTGVNADGESLGDLRLERRSRIPWRW